MHSLAVRTGLRPCTRCPGRVFRAMWLRLSAQTLKFPKTGDWIPAAAPLLQLFLLLLAQPCNMQHIAALIIAHAQARLLLKTSPPNKANPSFSFTMWYLRLLHIFSNTLPICYRRFASHCWVLYISPLLLKLRDVTPRLHICCRQ